MIAYWANRVRSRRLVTRGLKLAGLAVVLVSVFFTFGCDIEKAADTPTTPVVEPTPTPQPVEIVIYTDFQCGACWMLHSEVEEELLQLYVDTGMARLDMRLLPALGVDSLRAAEAALCAGDQDRFWEYRDVIFAAWRQVGPDAYSEEELQNAAKQLGLNEEAFGTCLTSGAKLAELEYNMGLAQEDSVTSVPTVFINGTRVTDTKPLETYVELIEELLPE